MEYVCRDKICFNTVKCQDLSKSLSTFLCNYTVFSMCTVSTTSLLMEHSRNRFIFKHHASDGLLKQRELRGSRGSQFLQCDCNCGG